MIYKHMYCGYKNSGNVEFIENKSVITISASNYGEMTFVYFETTDRELDIYDVCSADMKPFPNGKAWYEMSEIFHYYAPEDDADWERKIPNKTPRMLINRLKREKIASYVYYHVDHQNGNQYDCDKYYSIFLFDDIIVTYCESPTELVTLEDIKGKNHINPDPNWAYIMLDHFQAWPDGGKFWRPLDMEK